MRSVDSARSEASGEEPAGGGVEDEEAEEELRFNDYSSSEESEGREARGVARAEVVSGGGARVGNEGTRAGDGGASKVAASEEEEEEESEEEEKEESSSSSEESEQDAMSQSAGVSVGDRRVDQGKGKGKGKVKGRKRKGFGGDALSAKRQRTRNTPAKRQRKQPGRYRDGAE